MIDVLETDEGIVLVMEYVRGENLQQIMDRRHRLTPELTLDAGIQIGQAVRYLHSRKEPVFHLDIKPANIICAEGGRLVLADFGAAFRGNIEEDGKRRGTDGFAAPELYDPEAALTGAADIYELGAVLYYLISGVHFSA
jgi:serine/threonine-protein kinase